MTLPFDYEEAKKNLAHLDEEKQKANEQTRQDFLTKVISILKEEFKSSNVEVFLVGSITRPFSFTPNSDVDIVLKNFHEDRFDIWTKLERKMERQVEIILFEKCHFQEFVLSQGLKVV